MASYVTQREAVVYVPSGGQFRPDGVRLLRIPITTDGFVDASTNVIQATIRSGSATKILPFSESSFASLISEVRVYMSGVEVERLQDYGRLVEALSRGISMEKRINNLDLEFGVSRNATGKPLDVGFGNDSGYIHPSSITWGGGFPDHLP